VNRWIITRILAVLAVLSPAAPGFCATLPQPPGETTRAGDILSDPNAPDEQRRQAAEFLVSQSDQLPACEMIEAELFLPLAGEGGGIYILDAIARSEGAPPKLFPLIVRRLSVASPSEIPRILPAVAAYRTREAARLLVANLDDSLPDAVRSAAAESLVRLSGRDDLPPDRAAWTRWLHESERLSESQWRACLISSLARRNRKLDNERANLVNRLDAVLRHLHLATPADQRSPFLASLLRDSIPEVRALGLELVARELAASGSLGPEVGEAALALLRSPNVDERATAAGLVRQLSPPGAPDAVAFALRHETDPIPAGALLVASTRWPTPAVAESALRWLAEPGPARDRAAEATWHLLRAGHLNTDQQRAALYAARSVPDSDLTPAWCALLGMLGSDADIERLVPLLTHRDAAIRMAVAETLIWNSSFASSVVEAARNDPVLFDSAARALLAQGPIAETYRVLLSLPRPAPDENLATIIQVGAAMTPPDLWLIASELGESPPGPALLRVLASSERRLSWWDNEAYREPIAMGTLAYARRLLDENSPAEALALLDSLTELDGLPAIPGWNKTRATALLALGRIEEAESLSPPPSAYFEALALSLSSPHAMQIIDTVESRFGTLLTDAQKAELRNAREVISRTTSDSNGAAPR
jgi:hypothetical protein